MVDSWFGYTVNVPPPLRTKLHYLCNHCIAYVHEQELYLGYCTHQQNNCHCKDDCALAPYTIQTTLHGYTYVVTITCCGVSLLQNCATNMTLVTLFKCMAVEWSYS